MEEIFFFIPTLQQWRRSCKRVGLVLCIYMYFILFIYLFFFEHCLLSPLFIHLLWCCLYLRVNTWMNAASITFSRLVWFSRGCGSLMRSGCFWDTFGMFWDLWVCWSAWDAPKWPVFIDVGVPIFHRWMAAINPPFPYRALGVEPPSSSPPLPLLFPSSFTPPPLPPPPVLLLVSLVPIRWILFDKVKHLLSVRGWFSRIDCRKKLFGGSKVRAIYRPVLHCCRTLDRNPLFRISISELSSANWFHQGHRGHTVANYRHQLRVM